MFKDMLLGGGLGGLGEALGGGGGGGLGGIMAAFNGSRLDMCVYLCMYVCMERLVSQCGFMSQMRALMWQRYEGSNVEYVNIVIVYTYIHNREQRRPFGKRPRRNVRCGRRLVVHNTYTYMSIIMYLYTHIHTYIPGSLSILYTQRVEIVREISVLMKREYYLFTILPGTKI